MNKKYRIEKALHQLMNENEEMQKIDGFYRRGLVTIDDALKMLAIAMEESKEQ